MDVYKFCQSVITYRRNMLASVQSWGRTPKHNHDVGGDARSLHTVDKAVDVTYDGPPPPLEKAQTYAASLGLYIHREGTHDHLRPLDEVWA